MKTFFSRDQTICGLSKVEKKKVGFCVIEGKNLQTTSPREGFFENYIQGVRKKRAP